MVLSEETGSMQNTEQGEQPRLSVDYSITLDIFERSYRRKVMMHCLKTLGLLVLLLLAINVIFSAYYAAADGLPFWTVLENSLFHQDPIIWLWYAALFLFYIVMTLVVRPQKTLRQVAEVFGRDGQWRYHIDFFDTYLRARGSGQQNDARKDIEYVQISKIQLSRYDLLLLTSRRNGLTIYREGLQGDQEKQILTLLREKCPKVKGL